MKCALCDRPVVFYSHKKRRRVSDHTHDLCRKCYIAERQRFNQSNLAEKKGDIEDEDYHGSQG